MIDRASIEAQRRFPTHQGLRRAFVRGVQARIDGRPIDECPYGRRKRSRRARGWPNVWKSAWIGGWQWPAS